MNILVHVERPVMVSNGHFDGWFKKPGVIEINGVRFKTDKPDSAADVEEINAAIDALLREVAR